MDDLSDIKFEAALDRMASSNDIEMHMHVEVIRYWNDRVAEEDSALNRAIRRKIVNDMRPRSNFLMEEATQLEDSRLSPFAQYQLLQLQQFTELVTQTHYPLISDSGHITTLLAYTSDSSDELVREAYQTFIRSLGANDISVLRADFSCMLVDDGG